jgi:hypothetical protein
MLLSRLFYGFQTIVNRGDVVSFAGKEKDMWFEEVDFVIGP